MPASAHVVVARIGRPHGLRGEVTVQVRTDSPHRRFVPGARFDTQPDSGPLTLQTARVHQGIWLLGFAGHADREAAEALRGVRLTVLGAQPAEGAEADEADAEAAAAAEEGWYPQELAGLSVYDPAGRRIGEVARLELRGAQDLLEVRLDDGRSGRVPFVTALVPLVDTAAGRVVIDPPDGLFDLESG